MPVHHSRVLRWRAAAVAALAGTLLLGSTAQGAATQRFAYVASTGVWVAGPTALMATDTPAGRPTLLGELAFRPAHASFRITLDEHAATNDQTVQVRILQITRQAIRSDRRACLPVRTAVRVPVLRRVDLVRLEIVSDGQYELPLLRCSGRAVSGTATLEL